MELHNDTLNLKPICIEGSVVFVIRNTGCKPTPRFDPIHPVLHRFEPPRSADLNKTRSCAEQNGIPQSGSDAFPVFLFPLRIVAEKEFAAREPQIRIAVRWAEYNDKLNRKEF